MRWWLAIVALFGCGRVAFDARTDAGSDGSADGTVTPVRCNGIDVLDETFSGTKLDPSIWGSSYSDTGTSSVVTGGELVLTPASSAPSYVGAVTYRYYDLHDERLAVEITEVTTNGASTGMQLDYEPGTYVLMFASDGFLRAAVQMGTFMLKTTVPYDPLKQRFWAMSEAGGVISFETSPDGVTFTPIAMTPAPFDVSQMRLHIFAGSNTAIAAPGRARASSVRGSGGTTPRCTPERLVDRFDSTMLGRQWLNAYAQPCCSIGVSGGQLVLGTNGTSGYASIHSSLGYDLRGHDVQVELARRPTQGQVASQIVLTRDFSNQLGLAVFGGTNLNAFEIVNGVPTDHVGAWNPLERFLRVREAQGSYFAEVSTDGTTWRTAYTGPVPFALDNITIGLEGGTGTGGINADSAAWDNVNVPP